MRSAVAALDHLVLATPDLHATTAWLSEATGVVASPGGPHVGKGTRNELYSLGHASYLEIVGPDPAQDPPLHPRPFGIDDLLLAGIAGWAVAVADIEASIAAARRVGYDPGPAAEMQRRRPDGALLSWRLTMPTSASVPFLIEWETPMHPATDAAPGIELVELRARHPQPTVLSNVLAALGVEMGIERGPEALLVELTGPAGSVWFA
ncbi:unannotated protein [freshwater metagenome]|uniref:Unannotated protein n=1 Tax=freshwater metagenome TaxID=449393 RepID=A0A6J7F497_9ZZZZ|nr:VOC family protein [Actinomycetota bacterium]